MGNEQQVESDASRISEEELKEGVWIEYEQSLLLIGEPVQRARVKFARIRGKITLLIDAPKGVSIEKVDPQGAAHRAPSKSGNDN